MKLKHLGSIALHSLTSNADVDKRTMPALAAFEAFLKK
jgi:hypothetical protein